MEEVGEENWKTIKNILAPWKSWWVSKGHVASEKSLNPMIERPRRKTGQEINQ